MTAAAAATALGLAQAPAALAGTTTSTASTHASTTATTTPAVEVCGEGAAVTDPAAMILTCADSGERAEQLNWMSWTATSATATGLVAWRACAADCADATTWDTATAQFTLSDPVTEPDGGTLFTRLTLHTTGATPTGFLRDLSFNESPAPSSSATSARPVPGAAAGTLTAHASGATASSLAPDAAGGTLGYAQIEGYWIAAGGPSSAAETAAAIAGAESSFVPGAIQQDVDYCGALADRAGWGLWQITCGNSEPAYGSDFQLLDPWNNAEAAVSKYDGALAAGENGFDPWATYTTGVYQSHLESVSPASGLSDPGEYSQSGSTPNGTPSSPSADPGSTYGPTMPGTPPPYTAPKVSVAAPVAGQVATQVMTASAQVTAGSSPVTSVQFSVDGVAYGAPDTASPYQVAVDTTALSDGPHTLGVTATDASGHATSAAPAGFVVSNTSTQTVKGDFKGNGQDAVASIYDYGGGHLAVIAWYPQAGGTFSEVHAWDDASFGSSAQIKVVTGDFNGDGRDDIALVYGYSDHQHLSVTDLLGQTDGTFSATATRAWDDTTFGALAQTDVVTGDFNGDGRDDIALVYGYSDHQHVSVTDLLGQTDGTFSATGTRAWDDATFGDASYTREAVGDFNGDGRDDIALFHDYTGGHVSVTDLLGQTDGTLSATSTRAWDDTAFGDGESTRLAVGDFNGDGRDDLALFHDYGNGHVSVTDLLGQTNGTLSATSTRAWDDTVWGSGNATEILVGDFNGDGREDLALFYDYGSGHVSVTDLLGQTNGTLSATSTRAWDDTVWGSGSQTRIVTGDFSGDQRDDIALFYNYSDGVTASLTDLQSQTTGLFTEASPWKDAQFGSGPADLF